MARICTFNNIQNINIVANSTAKRKQKTQSICICYIIIIIIIMWIGFIINQRKIAALNPGRRVIFFTICLEKIIVLVRGNFFPFACELNEFYILQTCERIFHSFGTGYFCTQAPHKLAFSDFSSKNLLKS